MVLLIRPASTADAEDLASLAEAAFRRTYQGIIEGETIDAVVAQACTAVSFLRLLAAAEARPRVNRLLVATDGSELLGFLDFGEEEDGFELRRLYTRAGETGRGIGAALLAELESGLPPGTRYQIVVVPENTRGLAFWQRHGFRVRGEVDGFEHFSAHRGVGFDAASASPRLLVLDRTTGEVEAGLLLPVDGASPGSLDR